MGLQCALGRCRGEVYLHNWVKMTNFVRLFGVSDSILTPSYWHNQLIFRPIWFIADLKRGPGMTLFAG